MRRFFAHILLCTLVTGNVSSEVRRDCGGKLGADGETSGSLRYAFSAAVSSNADTHNGTVDVVQERRPSIACTWLIDARGNQSVFIEVRDIDQDSRLTVKFGNESAVTEYKKGVRAVLSGTGRTRVEWSWGNIAASRKLHLRWNTSEDSLDLTQAPYTHSNNDPVSPSPEGTNVITRTPNILGFGILSNSEGTRPGVSVKQGGVVSGLDDKSRPPVSQDGKHNGEEASAATISNLGRTATHSHADAHTRSALAYTHTDENTVIQTDLAMALSGGGTQMSPLNSHTLDGDYPNSIAVASTRQSGALTTPLTQSSPPSGTHTATEINSISHNGVESALLSSIVPRAGTLNSAEDLSPDPKVHAFRFVTDISDITRTTSTDEVVSMVTANSERNQPHRITVSVTPSNRALWTGTDIANRSPRITRTYVSSKMLDSDFSNIVSSSVGAVSHHQTNTYIFSEEESAGHSENTDLILSMVPRSGQESESTHLSVRQTQPMPTQTQSSFDLSASHVSHAIVSEHPTISHEISLASQHNTTKKSGFTKGPNTHHSTDIFNYFSPVTYPTMRTDLPVSSVTSVVMETENGLSQSPNTVIQEGERDDTSSGTLTSSSVLPMDFTTSDSYASVTYDFPLQTVVPTEAPNDAADRESITATSYTHDQKVSTTSSSGTHLFTQERQTILAITVGPKISSTRARGTDTAILEFTQFTQTSHSGNDIKLTNSSGSSFTSSPMIPLSNSPVVDSETVPSVVNRNFMDHTTLTSHNDPLTWTTSSHVVMPSSEVSTAGRGTRTSQTLQWGTSQIPRIHSTFITTPQPQITTAHNLNVRPLNPDRSTSIFETKQPHTSTPTASRNTHSYDTQTGTHRTSLPVATRSSQLWPSTVRMDRAHKGRVFIVEDQPAVIKEETFQVLLQIVLEDNSPSHVGLTEVEPFLHRVPGYWSQQVTWQSGPVVQAVVSFHTAEALSWLGRAESLLTQAGLNPLPKEGLFLGEVRVKNVTIGGLHNDVCSWLFLCPSGFQCAFSEGNASCRSICHSEYCKHHGICVHRHGQQPLCQCPVGEDFWFMGQQCDLRMTRQRLVGMCFGVLAGVATLMALLSYLAVRRFKSMLVQAKVDQTRSSYRRFNHFDELSARFWGRSWPGSEDSLDNPAFTRSDELLHMRALDRTCCYHDDTLSVTSTYQGSATHLSTVYPHGTQYHWDLSNCSLADCVVDSGKASDLSVCSWPIEPIQWTPFPLLQQLSRNANSVKASRARSYCEGMELVDLERSWTA